MYNLSDDGVTPVVGGAFNTRQDGEEAIKKQIAWDEEEIGETTGYQLMEVPLNISLFSDSTRDPLTF